MRHVINYRRAWIVALAGATLWLTTGPGNLAHLVLDGIQIAPPETTARAESLADVEGSQPAEPDRHLLTAGCTPEPLEQPAASSSTDQTGNGSGLAASGDQTNELVLHLCSDPAPELERTIEQFIAGRSFSARLTSRQSDCADLGIKVAPRTASNSQGRQSTSLSVSTGTGTQITLLIVSEQGVTHATIAASR